MMGRIRVFVIAAVVFAIVSAGECEFGSLGQILDEPGTIVLTNIGTEPAVAAIIADDVKTYPSLAAGATGSAQTNVGGRYQVQVVMTPENAQRYRDDLLELRGNVEGLIAGSTSSADKTRLFLQLAGIKAALASLEMTNAASCSGVINLDPDEGVSVSATVRWESSGTAGFWDLACGSNSE